MRRSSQALLRKYERKKKKNPPPPLLGRVENIRYIVNAVSTRRSLASPPNQQVRTRLLICLSRTRLSVRRNKPPYMLGMIQCTIHNSTGANSPWWVGNYNPRTPTYAFSLEHPVSLDPGVHSPDSLRKVSCRAFASAAFFASSRKRSSLYFLLASSCTVHTVKVTKH